MLKDLIVGGAYRMGYHVVRRVSNERVAALAARLRPVLTSKQLVRLGGEGDGGYLVPDDLDGLSACFSPGVDVTATFEQALLQRGIPCFLADASVDEAPISDARIDFERKYLGVVNDETTITLDDWVMQKQPAGGEFILQMDIEGAEWPVLLNVSDETLRSFRIVILELHAIPHAFDPVVLRMFEACLDRLGREFHVVHAHPNGFIPTKRYGELELPYFLEVTYLRKDRAEAAGYATQFPHPLDRSNVAGKADTPLPPAFRGRPA